MYCIYADVVFCKYCVNIFERAKPVACIALLQMQRKLEMKAEEMGARGTITAPHIPAAIFFHPSTTLM